MSATARHASSTPAAPAARQRRGRHLPEGPLLPVLAPGEGTLVALPGATMVWKAHSGRPGDGPAVGEFTAAPGFAGPRPHVHRTFEELFYVLEGAFDFLVGDQVVRVGPGAVVHVPPGVAHDFRNPTDRPARWLGIVHPGALDRYFAEVQALVATGAFSEAALRALRRRYDTDEPDEAPAAHWSHRREGAPGPAAGGTRP